MKKTHQYTLQSARQTKKNIDIKQNLYFFFNIKSHVQKQFNKTYKVEDTHLFQQSFTIYYTDSIKTSWKNGIIKNSSYNQSYFNALTLISKSSFLTFTIKHYSIIAL